MNRHWRTYGRAALALLLAASLLVVFAHWHRDSRGQDCGLCNVQHMPTLQSPAGNILIVPTNQDWIDFISEINSASFGFTPVQSGRAPPQTSFPL
jgi:hypothetical protein